MLSSLGIICILAAAGFHGMLRHRLFGVLAVALLVPGVLWCLALDAFYAQDRAASCTSRSAELVAAEWIATNIPAESRIGLEREPVPAEVPPLDLSRYRLMVLPKAADRERVRPEWIIISRPTPSAAGYQLVATFTSAAGPLHLSPAPSPGGRDPDDHMEHVVSFAGLSLGHPVVDQPLVRTRPDLVKMLPVEGGPVGAGWRFCGTSDWAHAPSGTPAR